MLFKVIISYKLKKCSQPKKMKTSEGSHITCKHWVQLTRHLSVGRKGHISLEWHQGDVGFAIWLCKSSLKLCSSCDQPLRLMKLWRHKASVILRVFILYSSFHLLTCVPAHPLTKLSAACHVHQYYCLSLWESQKRFLPFVRQLPRQVGKNCFTTFISDI